MLKHWFGSLVNRAVALVVVAMVLAALVVATAGVLLSRSELEQQARNKVETIADLIATELDDKLARRLEALNHVAVDFTMSEDAYRSRARVLLRQQRALQYLFDGIYLIGADGEVLAEHPEDYQQRGLNVSDREYFQVASSQLTPVISNPYISNYKDKPAVMVAAPVFDHSGRFIGMLGGAILLEQGRFMEKVTELRIGRTGYLFLATRDGTLIAHGEDRRVMVPVARDNPAIRNAMAGFQGTVHSRDFDGSDTIVSFRQLAQVPWFVAGVWPAREAYAPITRLADAFVWILAAVIVLVVPVALWVFRRLMAPLKTLGQQISDRYLGRRTQPVEVTGGHEIRQVAMIFNTVSDTLKQEQQRAETILGVMQEGVLMVDTSGRIRYANGAAHEFLGTDDGVESANFFDRVQIEIDGEIWGHNRFLASEDLDNRYGTLRNQQREEFDIDLTLLHIRQGMENERMVFVLRDDSERRRQQQRLSWEATHDSLTHLLNRRGFRDAMDKLLAEAGTHEAPSVLMLIDLDHFKPVNDGGGHLLGDDLLRRLAALFREAVRQSDIVARLGGDEFGILLPACGLERARQLAEAIRQSVEAVRLEHEGRHYGVTTSIGLTAISPNDSDAREVIARADEACYLAKSQGRNRVVVSAAADTD